MIFFNLVIEKRCAIFIIKDLKNLDQYLETFSISNSREETINKLNIEDNFYLIF